MTHTTARRRYIATPELKATIRCQGRMLRWCADQIGVTQGHFSHVLYGRRDISEAHARLLATLLGSDFDTLWRVSDGTESTPERTSEEAA